jgi:protein TonB
MKLDILKGHWVDMLFEGRNKSYGAYVLRKESPKTTMMAWVIGASLFIGLLALPLLNWDGDKEEVQEDVTLVDMTKLNAPPPKKEKLPEPVIPEAPPAPPAPKISEVKFVKPKVVAKEEATEEIATVEKLKEANVGSQNVKGVDNGKIAQDDAPSGIGDPTSTATQIVEDETVYTSVEVSAEFPGGIKKFYDFVGRNFRTPEDSPGGKIFVQFIVEKDGSLTDLKIMRGIDSDSDKEALRVLRSSPKWKPGVQNGHDVRQKFVLPITIQAPSN